MPHTGSGYLINTGEGLLPVVPYDSLVTGEFFPCSIPEGLMFEKYDLTKTIDETNFEKAITPLRQRLAILQRTLRDLNIPVIIVIEGWNAAGITMSTKEIIQSLDPRGFTLHATDKANDEERARPFMWRFWTKTPSKGRIALFARSWYSRALAEKLSRIGWKKTLKEEINSITVFERRAQRQRCNHHQVFFTYQQRGTETETSRTGEKSAYRMAGNTEHLGFSS